MTADPSRPSIHSPSHNGDPAAGNGSRGNSADRLESWKDIAAYFHRDIRTVQLWEKKEALPVHRHTHEGRSSVYAWPEELEAWLQTRTQARTQEEPGPPPAPPPVPRAPIRFTPLWFAVGAALAGTLACALFLLQREWQRQSAVPLASQTLAVLPFEDLSPPQSSPAGPSPPPAFLADGLTNDLITDLGQSGRSIVVSRLSAMQVKGQHLSLPQAARKLHATLVLQGTVSREDDSVRVTAQLADAVRDHQLWAARYSRTGNDILNIEEELAAQIADDVTRQLAGAPHSANAATRAVNAQARLACLTGRYLWNRRDEPDMRRAMDYFRQAIALDPGYAPAWAGLADSYNLMAVWGKLPSSEAFPQARSAAEMAISLDPSSSEAWNSLAFEVYRYEWDFMRADDDFRKAISLDPNYEVAHQWYGEFLGDLRRFDQSIAELRRAQDLDPTSAMAACDLADGYFHAGQYAAAHAELQRIMALYPDFVPAHSYMATVCAAEGKPACAQKEMEEYSRLSGDRLSLRILRLHKEAAAGNIAQARQDLAALLQSRAGDGLSSWSKAQLYFAVGQDRDGYAALEAAYQERSWWLVTLMVDPGFDIVRNQPRFIAMERRVGLPVPHSGR